jgi:hypothetical protein
MSISRVLFVVALVSVLGVLPSACKVQVTTKTRFTEPNVVKEDTVDWNGEPISINIQGVGVSINGGVQVTADPNAKRVTATARFLAEAFEKADADASIVEAKNTFTVGTSGGTTTVACGHGGSHGGSNGGESGCELIVITIPTGSADKPLDLTVLGGNGPMTLQLSAAVIKNVAGNNGGDITAQVPATKGAGIGLVAPKADDIVVTMPPNWAADEVILQADADKIHNGFPDAKLGQGAGGRPPNGTGLASIKLTSTPFAGSSGEVTLR